MALVLCVFHNSTKPLILCAVLPASLTQARINAKYYSICVPPGNKVPEIGAAGLAYHQKIPVWQLYGIETKIEPRTAKSVLPLQLAIFIGFQNPDVVLSVIPLGVAVRAPGIPGNHITPVCSLTNALGGIKFSASKIPFPEKIALIA
jgi:hypothetical protein